MDEKTNNPTELRHTGKINLSVAKTPKWFNVLATLGEA
jgi:hypothetical protein